jgi:hypothetical protein
MGRVAEGSPGLVGALWRSGNEAAEVLEHVRAEHDGDDFAVVEVELFPAMRQAAAGGLCGFVWLDGDEGGYLFATRVEEANHLIPTLLVECDADGQIGRTGPCRAISRFGPSEILLGDALPWRRWDLIDRAWGKVLGTQPVMPWEDGAPLYEIRMGEEAELWFGPTDLLRDWASADGTLAFFTTPELAGLFHETYEGQMKAMVDRPDDFKAELGIFEVTDLVERLARRTHPMPISIVLNPGAPRGFQAIVGHGPGEVTLHSASGHHRLGPGNRVTDHRPDSSWDGYGTLFWEGGGNYQLMPLARTFAVAPLGALAEQLDGATDFEVEQLLGMAFDDETHPLDQRIDWESLDPAETFVFDGWDTVGGERGCETFTSFLGALRWLSGFERRHDRVHRTEGAKGCWQIGFPGSDDAASDYVVGESFQAGLRRIAQRVINRGYRPQDGEDVVRLVNAVLRTWHVDAAGYFGDLVWQMQGQEDQLEFFTSSPEGPFTLEQAVEWLSQVQSFVIPTGGAEQVIVKLGRGTWDRLEPRSRLFLSTALVDFDERGGSPLLDYAPVSVGIVKALEVEMGAIFAAYRATRGDGRIEPTTERNDVILARFLNGEGPAPTLGEARHLLGAPKSPLHEDFVEFVGGLPNGADLRRSRFRELVAKIVGRYRNGGAHDQPIDRPTCEACINDLIGEDGKPGVLATVTRWKS